MGTASSDPTFYASCQARQCLPHDTGNGEIRHWQNGFYALYILADQSQTTTHINQADYNSRAGFTFKHKTCRVFFIHPDTQGVGLDTGLFCCAARANFQHMSTKAIFCTWNQIVSIVFHEERASIAVIAHRFHDGSHGSNFPVPFAAVAVSLRHQMLTGQAGQLLHAIQILECIRKCLTSFVIQHFFDGNFFSGLIANSIDIISSKVVAGTISVH